MNPVSLSIVLPAYEEESNLVHLLPRLKEALAGLQVDGEILVVDAETPRDGTPAVCAAQGVRYVPRRGGSSYGDAVKTGIDEAAGEWVVFMDADGSHNPGFISKLWPERKNAELVIASRYIPGGHTENSAILIFMSLVVNVVYRWVLGLRCADVSNSFRLYRGQDLKALELDCRNFDIVEEILVKLSFSADGYRVKEIPFNFEKRKEGKTKRNLLAFAASYLTTLARLHQLKRKAMGAWKANAKMERA
ncbi:MAG: glycosyltransferase [Verrucomicrobium sp.]|nr:glycosyltransferase [Verrucomicrobium sp.]